MNFDSLVNFCLIAGVIQAIVFHAITWWSKKEVHKVVLYLNLTVLFISLNNFQAWLTYHEVFKNVFFLKQMLVPWYVFILPANYSFLRYFLQVEEVLKTFMKYAVILFCFQVILRVSLIIYVKNSQGLIDENIISRYTDFEDIFNLIFSIYVFYKCFVLVFRRQDAYQTILSYDDINWIKLFLKLGALIVLLWVLQKVFTIFLDDKSLNNLLKLSSSVLLYWLGYHGLHRFHVVRDRIKLRRSIADRNKELNLKMPLNTLEDKHAEEFEKIKRAIMEKQKFLDSNLTMNALAEELGISNSHLSKLINNYSGYNFSDFINSLRVDQAKELLSDPSFSHYTIISIGLECGFNSKSTFYSAFKKFTSLTPTEYQDRLNLR